MSQIDRGAEFIRNKTTVVVTTLDEELAQMNPSFIKIDVEGFEDAALDGTLQTLVKPSLLVLLLETVNGHVKEKLARRGLRLYACEPFTRMLTQADPATPLAGNNQLYIRDIEAVRQRIAEVSPFRALGPTI